MATWKFGPEPLSDPIEGGPDGVLRMEYQTTADVMSIYRENTKIPSRSGYLVSFDYDESRALARMVLRWIMNYEDAILEDLSDDELEELARSACSRLERRKKG